MKLLKIINRIGLAVMMAATAMTASAQATQAGAPVAPRSFNQDVVKGMEDVLILNPISKLILAGAPDSVLFAVTHWLLMQDIQVAASRNVQPSKVTGTYMLGNMEEDLTMAPFRVKDADIWVTNQLVYPASFKCIPMLKFQQNTLPSELNWDEVECSTGGLQQLKVKEGLAAHTNYVMRVVQKIKADVKRATSFGVVIEIGDGSRFGDKHYTGDMRGHNITETEFGTGINFNRFSGRNKYLGVQNLQSNLSVLSDDGTWFNCETYEVSAGASSNKAMFYSSMAKDLDVTSPCLKFKGLANIRIPRALLVRDLKQFDPLKQKLAVVMIVANPRKITTQRTDKGNAMKLIEVTPIGWHVIDGNTASTLTPKKIDINQPGVFLRQSPIECVRTYVGFWGAPGLLAKNEKETAKAFEICRNDLVEEKKKRGMTAEQASAEIAKEESMK